MQNEDIIPQTTATAQVKPSHDRRATRKRSSRKKPCYVYVPESFAPNTVLPDELRRYADAARYFLHRIVWGHLLRKRTLDQFVPLKFDYLRAAIPDRVIRPLKEALIEKGVVECDGQYIEGRKSLGYRLAEKYRSDRIIRFELTDRKTAEKVHRNRGAKYKKVRLDVHRWLRSQFRRLDIDLTGALNCLAGHPRFEIVRIPIEEIAKKEVEFSVCRYGRVHTSLTRCPKCVRSFLKVNMEPLIGLDIKNSQPLFLSLLVVNYRKRANKTFGYLTFAESTTDPYREIDKIIQKTVLPFPYKNQNDTSPSLCTAITTRKANKDKSEHVDSTALTTSTTLPRNRSIINDYLQEDELLFIGLCERGELYEHLCSHEEFPVRKWAKQRFFEVIFGKTRATSPMKSMFAADFPNVAEVVRAHKKKDYRHLPRLLQNIEANFIINTVCRRIMNEIPDAPIFTIHDSVLTTRQFVEPIRTIMMDEFARLGLTPSLHEKDYGQASRSAPQKPPDRRQAIR